MEPSPTPARNSAFPALDVPDQDSSSATSMASGNDQPKWTAAIGASSEPYSMPAHTASTSTSAKVSAGAPAPTDSVSVNAYCRPHTVPAMTLPAVNACASVEPAVHVTRTVVVAFFPPVALRMYRASDRETFRPCTSAMTAAMAA